ncbi:hypothetical protein [Isoptericola aurantiacus]|uniref:hypothetical protein n=1 Tax=Isoptericola aurantiacus TaxID=3377839 RepID=UPI00383BF102
MNPIEHLTAHRLHEAELVHRVERARAARERRTARTAAAPSELARRPAPVRLLAALRRPA